MVRKRRWVGLGRGEKSRSRASKREDRRDRHRAGQVKGGKQVGEGKGPYKRTYFPHSGRNAMCCSTNHHRKDLRRVDKSGHVWPKLGEEVAQAIDQQEGESECRQHGRES